MQGTVNRCPPGGSVLMLLGTHAGPLVLGDKEVYIFGRGRAALQAASHDVITSTAAVAAIDGLVVRREGSRLSDFGVRINAGRVRLQVRASGTSFCRGEICR